MTGTTSQPPLTSFIVLTFALTWLSGWRLHWAHSQHTEDILSEGPARQAKMKMARSWDCPICNVSHNTAFCPQSGEQPLRPNDLTARDLFTQAIAWLTSFDGRLPRTVRHLLMRPGALTADHIRGDRRRYLGPLQIFLIANALFFAVQSWTQTAILSSPLRITYDGAGLECLGDVTGRAAPRRYG